MPPPTVESELKAFEKFYATKDIQWQRAKTTRWSKEFLNYFLMRGKKNNKYLVYAKSSISGQDYPEYLVDLCWWTDGKGHRLGAHIALALEIEWNPEVQELDRDFWKLIDVKAPIKIAITSTSIVGKDRLKEQFEGAIRASRMRIKNVDETYGLAIFTYSTKGNSQTTHLSMYIFKQGSFADFRSRKFLK